MMSETIRKINSDNVFLDKGFCCKEAMEDDYFPSYNALMNPPDSCPYCGKKFKNDL